MSNDFILPPIPGEETNELNQDDLQTEETSDLESLLAGLPTEPEASASTDSPMELIASSAIQASTSNTAPAALESWTLSRLGAQPPETVCARCQAAIWQLPESGELRVYCRITRMFEENLLQSCDGQALASQLLQQ